LHNLLRLRLLRLQVLRLQRVQSVGLRLRSQCGRGLHRWMLMR
jgi:hypothetical protein